MKRGTVGLIAFMILGLLVAPLLADAQQRDKTYRIGFLFDYPSPRFKSLITALLQGLREHGYMEGQHFTVAYRWARAHLDQYPTLAVELVQLPVDVIVAQNSVAALAAKQVTTTIPIVVASAQNPVKTGLVASLAHPGDNVTGMAYPAASALSGKKFELLMEIAPQMSRVALVWNSNNRGLPSYKKAVEVAAQMLGVTLQLAAIRGPDDVDTALALIVQERAEGLVVFSDSTIMAERQRIIAFADQHRLPAVWAATLAVRDGALIAYSPYRQDMYRRAGSYVAKILQGAKAANLPMERADRIDLAINLQTAQRRGLTIPPSLLLQATKVIR